MRRLAVAVFLTGCAASAPRPVSLAPAALDRWEASSAEAESRTLARAEAAGPREVVRIAPERPPRLRGRRIDVRLHGASLSSAFRLLADAADVSIVIGEGLDAPVSVDLRRVHPIEAMWALAEAHDVELSRVGTTVIARRR